MSKVKFRPGRIFVLWLGGVVAIGLYPYLVDLFTTALEGWNSQKSVLSLVLAILSAAGVFLPSLAALMLVGANCLNNVVYVRERALLHVLVCLPAIFTLILVTTFVTKNLAFFKMAWYAVAIALLVGVYLLENVKVGKHPAWLRVTHGILALVFIASFFALHWMNHAAALWSSESHGYILKALRLWYRSDFIEPILLAICAALVISGFYMGFRYCVLGGDKFRRLQTVSGSYLGVFFCAHLLAVLTARQSGKDTNWNYATGSEGLLFDFQFLIPYYTFSLVCFTLHSALAIRQILLAHKQSEKNVRWIYSFVRGAGILLTGLTISAALGFSINV